MVKPNVMMSLGSGRSLSMVLGTWATVSPSTALASREAAKAVSSPPIVTRWSTPRRLRASATLAIPSGVRVGFVRDVRMMEPPSKWMREVSLISSSTMCSMSPWTSHLKPS